MSNQTQQVGTVYLVGAGPGDPGLITVAGKDALTRANVVFYDRLAHPSLLGYVPKSAERVFVGKQSATHFVRQEDTNDLMADAALQGKTVVRLKGGDPFVFGRGGEEAEYLRGRGVPFVIVPGVTSAIAAPAYAGIPVTHRDAASSFAVITGHERDDKTESGTRAGGAAEQRRRWDRIAWAADTLVFLMGVEALEEISARLIENGRSPETPVALVQWGTWTRQRVVAGTLTTICEIVREAGITAPAVTIIGDVVNWRDRLRWFDSGPLFGRKIVVTRAREQASELSDRLRSLGAEPVEFPTIRITDPSDEYAALDNALTALSCYDWVVFTSANAVSRTFARLAQRGGDARSFGSAKVAAVGPATAEALIDQGIRADFVPEKFVAEDVLTLFPPVAGKRILLPRAREAREALPDGWRQQGATVDIVETYRTVLETEGADAVRLLLTRGELDAITFTSSSTVRNFIEAMGSDVTVPASTKLIAIGPVTAETCRELIRAPDYTADRYTIDGLTETLLAAFAASES